MIMQWNALPTRLQRELFDNAGSMGELMKTPALLVNYLFDIRRVTNEEEVKGKSDIEEV